MPEKNPRSSTETETETKPENKLQKKKKLIKLGSNINPGSQIPRSSSVHRLVENKQPVNKEQIQDTSKLLIPLQLRKSFSQMDMKMSKIGHRFHNNYTTVALPKPVLRPKNDICNKIDYYPSKECSMYYVVNEPKCDDIAWKLDGLRIFGTIILNSWRKKRNNVRRLSEEVEQLQKRIIKIKNQVHVLSSVFRNEQKQNDKLNRQIAHYTKDIQKLQANLENLTTSLISAKADVSYFEQQFRAKEQENESLNNIIVETNSQLFKSMSQVRQLQTSLSCEQRTVQQLENQKNELLNEISLNEIKWKNQEEKLMMQIYNKDEELIKSNSEIKILETLLIDLKEKEFLVRDLKKSDLKYKNDIEKLKTETIFLKEQLEKCFGARMQRFWGHCKDFNYTTVLLIHLAAFYLLPAIPPPKALTLPFSLSLDKSKGVIITRLN